MRHSLVHLLGCLLPLLVIFLLPLFGIGGGAALILVIVLMFACHLFMMRGHAHGDDAQPTSQGGRSHENH